MKKEVSPSEGGCWFCFKDTEPLIFDTEFDTHLHYSCLNKAYYEGDEEAEIMAYLLEEKDR